MDNFRAIAATMDGLSSDLDRIARLVHEICANLDSAARIVDHLTDPSAREAERIVRSARAELREVLAIWFNEYATCSSELKQRLRS